ncbi:MAG: molecular chaperone HtpG [Gammaproteobacteria bacterium]
MAEGSNKEELGFESEVQQLLDLVINSLYSNKEIFLRELVSNASDAVDKLRFSALSDDALYESDPDLSVIIDFNEKKKTITVSDNGIGMNREDVIANLGTIAKSGTKEFFGALSGDETKDSQLIGQFGVGFYAAFIVAEKVVVTSRKAGDKVSKGVRWESEGKGDYSVESVDKIKRGTDVVLYLKKEAKEFASNNKIREICKKYSDHIAVPIRMIPISGEGDHEVINEATAIWKKAKSEISVDDYKEFYRLISNDFMEPLKWVHSQVEGKLEYTTLFYIPQMAPFDLWDRDSKQGIKLYVQRVFIMDDAEELLPRYLRFVKGVIDTNDLPLNVSRELLQKDKALEKIRLASIKKILGLVERLSKTDDYQKFWTTFGRVLKEGIVEDEPHRERISKLLRFSSTVEGGDEPTVGFADYVSRMKEDQTDIFYITADSFATAKNSPHIEYFLSKGLEVLLLHDPIDEWVTSHLTEFDGKKLKSIVHADLDEEKDGSAEEAEDSKDEQEHGEFLEKVKTLLSDKVADVRTSKRLTSSPACLVSSAASPSANMERLLQAAGQQVPESKRILELNMDHPIITLIQKEKNEDKMKSWCNYLFGQSIVAEGGKLDDPAAFIQNINQTLLDTA